MNMNGSINTAAGTISLKEFDFTEMVKTSIQPEWRESPAADFSVPQLVDIVKSIIFVWSPIGILHCPNNHVNWELDLGEIKLFSM